MPRCICTNVSGGEFVRVISVGATLVVGVRAAPGQTLFSESFDSSATAVVALSSFGPGTQADFVTFSTLFPESPRHTGGLARRFLRLVANRDAGAPGVAAVTAFAAASPGGAPLSFSASYRVSFDAYLSVNLSGLPYAGSTESLLWGVGSTNTLTNGRGFPAANNDGTWGWLAADGGFLSEDAVLCVGNTPIEQLHQQPPGAFPGFSQAFGGSDPVNVPWNQWTRVDIDVTPASVRVFYNDVLFHDRASTAVSGFAFLGYQDPFAGLNAFPTLQYGLFDNFTVTVIPEPGIAGLPVAMLLVTRRRRASPASQPPSAR